MMRPMKKLISAFMAFVMILSMLPVSAFAKKPTQDVGGGIGFTDSSTLALEKQDPQKVYDTYYFYDANGNKVGDWTQTVTTDDVLYLPVAPEKAGAKFVCWSEDGVNPVNTAITVGETAAEHNVYPLYQEVGYVFFLDATGDSICHTAEGKPDDPVDSSEFAMAKAAASATLEAGKSIVGWAIVGAAEEDPPVSSLNYQTGSVTLTPVVKDGHWITYLSEGGSYVAPEFCFETTKAPTAPTRIGYTFQHWSTTQNGSKAFTFGGTLDGDITLYAVWAPNKETAYTVVFWKQCVTDGVGLSDAQKTYDYDDRDVRTEATGATVSVSNADRNKSYTGFHYGHCDAATEVAPDGSTVLNVYYDRDVMTITFKVMKNGSWKDYKTISGLYGSTFKQNDVSWPTEYNYWYYYKDRWTTQEITFLDSFIHPNGGAASITFYGGKQDADRTIYHYKEALDGTWVEASKSETNSNGFKFTNKFNGFTVAYYSSSKDSTMRSTSAGKSLSENEKAYSASKLYVYHTRNSYDFDFYDMQLQNGAAVDKIIRTEKVKYEASLAAFATYKPVKEGYIFAGWYADAARTQEFDFTRTMPANKMAVYAKWVTPEVDALVYLTMAGTDDPKTITVNYGEKLDQSKMPIPDDAGERSYIWCTKEGNTYIPFNFDTLMTKNVTLYPYYTSSDTYSVTYVLNNNGYVAPVDGNLYFQDARAKVMAPPAELKDTFDYWQDSQGNKYQPNGSIVISSDIADEDGVITLEAVYKSSQNQIVYHANYTVAEGESDAYTAGAYIDNQLVTLADYTATGMPVRDGYRFMGWSLSSNSTETVTSVIIKGSENNDVYAVWARVYHVYYWNVNEIMAKPVDDKDYVTGEKATVLGSSETHDGSTGHYLAGWMKESQGTYIANTQKKLDEYKASGNFVPFGTELTIADADINLYAVWANEKIAEKYTVTYDLDGGTSTTVQLTYLNIPHGEATPKIDEPTKTGYTFTGWIDKDTNEPYTTATLPTTVTKTVTYKAQWEKDEEQTDDLSYKVEYRVDSSTGKLLGSEEITVDIWVNDSTYTVESVPSKSFTGYKLATSGSTVLPAIVEDGDTIYVIYEKDESQKKDLSYKVEYRVDSTTGTKLDEESKTVQIWVNDSTYSVTSVTEKTFPGYKPATTGSTELPATVKNGDTIYVIYEKDESQKHSVKAQVQYFYGDTLAEAKGKTDADATDDVQTATGWIGEPTTVTVTPNETDKFVGYKYDSTEGALSYTVAAEAATDTTTHIVNVYYVKDESQKHSVKAQVQYFYGDTLAEAKGKTDADATDDVQTATGWIGEATTVTVRPNTTDKFTGYKYQETVGDLSYSVAAEAATDTTTHIVNVYYVKDESQKHSVKAQVQYFYGDTLAEAKGKTDADATDDVQTATGWIGEATTVTVRPNTTDKFTGYKYQETVGDLSYSVAAGAATDETAHIVKVYYVKDTFGYTVNYILLDRNHKEVTRTTDSAKSGLFGDPIPYENGTRTYDGEQYVFLNVAPKDAVITEVAANNVLNVYFGIDTIGTKPDPEEPDGTPDEKQIVFEYRAETGGTVSKAKEVVTKNAQGKASPTGATATPAELYLFDRWQNGETTDTTPGMDTFKTVSYTSDQTFTAYFIEKVTSLSIDKTSAAVNPISTTGDTISYTITVTNTGNIPLDKVVVTDALTGNTGDDAWTIETLAPGASEIIKTSYIVSEADVFRTNGHVDARNMLVNTAVAEAPNPLAAQAVALALDEEEPQTTQQPAVLTAQDTAENEVAYRNLDIEKIVVNPQDVYDFGNVIQYQITVKNNGTYTEPAGLTITDQLNNAAGNVTYGQGWNNGVYTLPELKPGDSVTVNCSYTVLAGDEGRVITNTAAVRRNGTPEDISTSEGSQVINLYTLTIQYVDEAGNLMPAHLAPTYIARMKAGTPFHVNTPVVAGYTANIGAIDSGAAGMPAHNLVFTVVYTANTPDEEPEEPEVNVVTPTEDGGYDLTPISELDTPLANMDLGDHTCCIMHFLLMLASLITLAFYTDSRKKHQARIHQLKQSLKAEGKNDPSEKM